MKYDIEKSQKPKYLQIYKQIKADIITNAYPFNAKLPSKRILSEELSVSVITIEHAYQLLIQEGYIESKAKSGYYVIYKQDDFLSQQTFEETQTNEKEVMGIVNYGIGLDDVKYSILISEIKPNVCKISVRSKLDADSSELCAYFGGGGHKYAAGCKIVGKPETVKAKLLEASRMVLCKE